MAAVGEEMVNSVSRERFVWRHTAESTYGEFCEFDLHLDEGALVAAAHLHPGQQERFEVKSGSIQLRSEGQEELLSAGDARTIDAGVAHAWGNAASGETLVTVRLTPALRSEAFFASFCKLASEGRVNAKGMPRNPLRLAVWRMSIETWRVSRERAAALRLWPSSPRFHAWAALSASSLVRRGGTHRPPGRSPSRRTQVGHPCERGASRSLPTSESDGVAIPRRQLDRQVGDVGTG